MAKLGVFGGTFDPPHVGHLILAAEAYHQLHLDRLFWVITPDPPHKNIHAISPIHHRLRLLRAALADNPLFELSTVDIDRPGPHFAVDTVRLLQERHPGDSLAYLIGGDSLRDLPTWRDPAGLLGIIATLGVLRRPEDQVDLPALESQLPGISAKLRFIHAPMLTIASSDIRKRIQENRPFRYFLPQAVYQLIQAEQWYRSPKEAP